MIMAMRRPEARLLPYTGRCYSYQHPHFKMANNVGSPQDFFSYTSRRWIWEERQQLQERYREFDILELQKIALGEGLYNKSFMLTMADGKAVVARIPNPNAGPTFLTTASEVATMDFLRNILHIPVPKVLAWNSAVNSTNRIGAEYIIMEYAPGKNLANTIKDIVAIYGCLFYRKDAPSGSFPAIVKGDNLLHENKNSIAKQFSIGPTVDMTFWSKGQGDMDIDRGPWASAVDYVRALALRETAWIQKHASPLSPKDPSFEDILGSFLWHLDLRTPNIFVNDTGYITSIIDWQSICAGPLFLEGRHPHLLDYNGALMLELPEDFKQLDKNMQTTIKDKVTKSVVLYLYEKYTAERNPLLHKVFQYPNGKTLTDPIRFVGNIWEGDILPLQESLIRVQKEWDFLVHTTRCPIDFSPEELRKHHEDGEGWNEVQDFWDGLSGIMERDGWTSHATYDQAISIYSQIQAEAASQTTISPGNSIMALR
ncbi:aminoglycoside phosphotransferase family protein [Aspergillus stella-maris]|uniref:aminoglycoside phosphotransferase family protein n=1 Tax=Aspergillus stella-maris TaxID=1810926 RepID=UPI003CCD0328